MSKPRVASLFSGVGGFEKAFEEAGWATSIQCELDPAARFVLRNHFDSPVHDDITTLESLPEVECVTAGFPCTNLSQQGNKAGIKGEGSGLVEHVFRLLERSRTPWVVLENVKNMLFLHKGQAMDILIERLEELGYRWAYRTVDARSFGLPQRRERVIFVASLHEDPVPVLFSDNNNPDLQRSGPAYGFYWNMGGMGIGWAEDAVPPIKSIPPSLWVPGRVSPVVWVEPHAGEELQGFDRGWSEGCEAYLQRRRYRWRLIGNAIPVPIARWVAERILGPGEIQVESCPSWSSKWPLAAHGGPGRQRVAMLASQFPLNPRAQGVLEVVRDSDMEPLTPRAARGFLNRYERGKLNLDPNFIVDVRIAALDL